MAHSRNDRINRDRYEESDKQSKVKPYKRIKYNFNNLEDYEDDV